MRPYLFFVLIATLISLQPAALAIEMTVDLDWKASGITPRTNSRTGESVAYAGDVNGDGYGDVIVGSRGISGPTFGQAYVFYGTASGLPATPDETLDFSPDINNGFGWSVNGAGDVNGDGYDDVIVGADCHSNGNSCEGAALVFLGSDTGVSTTYTWQVESNNQSARMGQSVSSAGDVNDDGYDDVIVGAKFYTNGESSEGAAFIYLGSESGLATTPQVILEGNSASGNFGFSVSGAGDVNGDGYDDVIVGAPQYGNDETAEGRVMIFPGSASGVLATPIFAMESDQVGAEFGYSVSRAGDINADGFDDAAVGARYYDNGESGEGRAYVILGEALFATPIVQSVEVNQSSAYLGFSISGGGDFNHDGYDDLLVGAESYDPGAGDYGAAFLFLGSSNGIIGTPAFFAESATTTSSPDFGFSVAIASDVNGDDWDDLIIGSPLWDEGGISDIGMAWGVYGHEIGLNPDFPWTGQVEDDTPNDQLGWSVSDAGDVNGDGYGDVIVGQPYYDNGAENEGAAFLYLGSETGLSDFSGDPIEQDTDGSSTWFGYSVSAAGDVNKDGFDDVIITSPRASGSVSTAGAVFIYLGSDSGLASNEYHVFEGDEGSAQFGNSADAGDFNGDGFIDIVVGAPSYDDPEVNEGAAFVYLGSESGFASTPDTVMSKDQGNVRFGTTVSTAGDVNGDGYDDIVVSATTYIIPEQERSAVFLYLGSETGVDNVSDWQVPGGYALVGAIGGRSSNTAGDVNGDGFDDIIVGNFENSNNGLSQNGEIRLYLGSSTGPALVPDWTDGGDASGAQLGSSVSNAGDVNNDGYDDIIAGAPRYGNEHGRAYLYLGNADGTPEIVSTLNDGFRPEGYVSVGLYYGMDVSTAGDINGDGADDLILGQPAGPGVVFAYHGLPKDIWLRGKVVDAADGVTPVYPVAIDLLDPVTGDAIELGVTNNPDGSYEFAGLEPGEYKIFFNAVDAADHYIDELFDEVACDNGGCDRATLGDTIVLDYGNNILDEDLVEGATLVGTIVDADDSSPVYPVFVSLHDPVTGVDLGGVLNNPDGSYATGGFPAGEYKFFFNAFEESGDYIDELYDEVTPCQDGGCDLAGMGDTMVLAVGDNILDEELNQGASISGNISGSDTQSGVEGISLWMFDLQCGFIAGSSTDVNGDYRISVPAAGDYYLFAIANDALYIDQQSPYMNQQYPGINMFDSCYPVLNDLTLGEAISVTQFEQVTAIDFVLDPGATIRGTISDINGVLPNETAIARLYKTNGDPQVVSLNLEGDGSYRIGGVMPGSYHVVLSSIDIGLIDEQHDNIKCPRGSCDLALGTVVDIVTGLENVTGIDAVLDSGAVINGNLTDALTGNPIAGQCLYFYTEDGIYAANGCTDENGDYATVTGLPDGNYRLSNQLNYLAYRDVAGGYVPQVWTSDGSFLSCGEQCDFTLGDTFNVTGTTPVENIDLAMYKAGTVSGALTAEGFGAVGTAGLVSAYTDGVSVAFVATDANGNWSMQLDPGDYQFFFGARANIVGNYVISGWDGTANGYPCPYLCEGSGSELLAVSVGALPVKLDMELKLGVKLSGTVKDSDTLDPLTFEGVEVWNDDGSYYMQISPGTTAGEFASRPLPIGNYYAASNAATIGEGYIDELWNDIHCEANTCDPNNQTATLISPSAGDTVVLDFLLDQGRKISGTVSAEDGGALLEDVKVCLGHKIYTDAKECAITDASGHYEIGGLVFIDDFVVYIDDVGGQGFFREMYNGQECCDVANGTSVDVTASDAVVDFALASSGRISGYVEDVVTGQPITNVSIELYDADGNMIDVIPTTTDDDTAPGFYAVSGVPDGIHYIFANSEYQGYSNELYPDIQRFRPWNQGAVTDGKAIVIENHNHVDGIDFSLDPAGTISGTVSDSNGVLPFNRAHIRLYESGTRNLLQIVNNWNEDGSYTLPGLPPGNYDVLLSSRGLSLVGKKYDDIPCPRNSCDVGLGDPVSVGPSEHVEGIDAVLDEGAVIAGIITDADTGLGVPNFCLGFYTIEGIYAGFGCTGQDGAYGSAQGFPEGQYYAANQIFDNPIEGGYLPQVWTEDGSFVTCGSPCNVQAGDLFTVTGTSVSHAINLEMDKGSSISGNVQFGGNPLEAVDVVLLDKAGNLVNTVNTDASGNYLFQGINPGNYYVRTLNNLGYLDSLHAVPTNVECTPDCNLFSGTLISLAASDDISAIDLTLGAAASISGVITDGDTNPIPSVVVQVFNSQASLVNSAITNANGEYVIGGLGAGEFFVRTLNQSGFLDRLYGGQVCAADCDERQGDPVIIPVELTDAMDINIQLLAGGAISGTVLGDDGTQLIPLVGTIVRIYASSGVLAASILTDSNGNYEVAGLAAGDYHVITSNDRTRANLPYVGEDLSGAFCQQGCDPLTTPTATLGEAQVLDIDFELQKGQPIYLNVTDSNGDRISSRLIFHAYNENGDLVRTGRLVYYKKVAVKIGQEPPTVPDFNGTLRNLAPGVYFVQIAGQYNYAPELYNDIPCYQPCDPLQGTRIIVTEEPPSEILQISLTASNTISGSVQLAGSDPLTGIAGITVMLYTDTGNLLNSVVTDQDGNYAFEGLPNGDYRLKSGGSNAYVDKVYGGSDCSPSGCDILAGALVRIRGSDRSNLNFLVSQGGSISGYARDSAGNTLYGIAHLFGANGVQIETAVIQNGGLFLFDGIADGTYYVYVDAQSRRLYSHTSCHYHYTYHFNHTHRDSHCWSNYYYTSSTDTLFNGVACPGLSCDPTTGTAILLGSSGSALLAGVSSQAAEPEPPSAQIEIVMATGHQIRGSVRSYLDEPLAFVRVYFFNQEGIPAGSTVTDGDGNFVSSSGLPDGTYFAATSRAAVPSDDPFSAEDAEAGVGRGLQDAAWKGSSCDGICAPSQTSGFGTPIPISGADATGIDIVLSQAAGIEIEKLTNGIDADTANDGEAPQIKVGDTVDWIYRLTNTGGADLEQVLVNDNQGVTISCPRTTLAVAASMDCTASGLAEDVNHESFEGVTGNCGGKPNSSLYQNIATVTAQTTGAEPVQVEDEDSSHYCNLEELIFGNSFE